MKLFATTLFLLLILIPGLALAHTNTGGTGFLSGVEHPIGGLDHVLAMVAVGLWAAQSGGRSVWILSGTFVGVMVAGGILGFAGMPLPFVEAGILSSVVILGILTAGAFRLPLGVGCGLVSLFAIFHGHAHGAEMPASAHAAAYAIGFALGTTLLHLTGITFGILMQKINLRTVSRFAGGAIALGGLFLAFA